MSVLTERKYSYNRQFILRLYLKLQIFIKLGSNYKPSERVLERIMHLTDPIWFQKCAYTVLKDIFSHRSAKQRSS